MRSFYFDNEKKELKRKIISKTIWIFLSGVICATYSIKAIESFIEADVTQGCIYLLPILIWGFLGTLEVILLRQDVELSIDFLRDMFYVHDTYKKLDIKRLENEVKELQDELGKFKNTEV